MFAPGASGADLYICYVSGLQYLFVRNYINKQIVRRVALMHFPSTLQVVDFNKVANELKLKMQSGGLQALVSIGTKEGRVLIYKLEDTEA